MAKPQMSDSTSAVEIVRTVKALRARVAGWRAEGLTVGLIPTMGALHAGHISLVEAALARYDRAVATLFINPRQFNSAADLAKYPRTEVDDSRKLAAAGAHLLYAPDGDAMYPPGYATNISVSGVSSGLCGADRPGHFDGVATVCTKLFLQSGADGAFFGEKDFQQLQVVRRFVQDLNIPIEIHPCPTVREADGLALSSRNMRLTPRERQIAPALHRALQAAAERLSAGADAGSVLAAAAAAIRDAGFDRVDYLELRDGGSLAPLERAETGARIFAAAWLDEVRLIDNIPVGAA
jgi:pantoate--beta-alanine ligase